MLQPLKKNTSVTAAGNQAAPCSLQLPPTMPCQGRSDADRSPTSVDDQVECVITQCGKTIISLGQFRLQGWPNSTFLYSISINQCKSAVFAGMTLQNSNFVDEFTVLYSTLQYFTVLYSMLFAFFAKDEVTTCNNQTTRLDALGHPLTILPWQWQISMLHSANSQSIGRRAIFCHVFFP